MAKARGLGGKGTAPEPGELSLIPGTHIVEETTASCKLSSDLHRPTVAHPEMSMWTKQVRLEHKPVQMDYMGSVTKVNFPGDMSELWLC